MPKAPIVSKVWSQSIARRELLGGETQNPSLAARSLLGKVTRVAQPTLRPVVRFGRRRTFKRRQFFRENIALPAAALSLAGKLFGGSKKPQDLAALQSAVTQLQQALVDANESGDFGELEKALIYHEGFWPRTRVPNEARQALGEIRRAMEAAKKEHATATKRQAAAEAEAEERQFKRQRGMRFIEAGETIGAALGPALLSRGRRLPRRRRRRAPRYGY